jgi:hypothetical protein
LEGEEYVLRSDDLEGDEYCGVPEFTFDDALSMLELPTFSRDFLSGVVEYTFRVSPPVSWVTGRVSLVLGLLYSCFEGVVR